MKKHTINVCPKYARVRIKYTHILQRLVNINPLPPNITKNLYSEVNFGYISHFIIPFSYLEVPCL